VLIGVAVMHSVHSGLVSLLDYASVLAYHQVGLDFYNQEMLKRFQL
jgi:hypothetical protein